ncbi:MAG TPA: hypothetical protein VN088_16195 [Nocardioides sp.]|nr:hypothetical protein [Nocardioides sp.]
MPSPKRRPMTLAAVVRNGDEGASLRALRDRLATEIDSCDSKRDVAALASRLVDVLERLAAMTPVEAKETPLDEVAARRAAAAGASGAGGDRGRR